MVAGLIRLLVAREEAVAEYSCQRTVPYLELTFALNSRMLKEVLSKSDDGYLAQRGSSLLTAEPSSLGVAS